MVLVTGGVHGYESSGIHGALMFVHEHLAKFSEQINVLVLPCVSPWGYETVNRWTPDAVDPNRSFLPTAPGCGEAANAMGCVMLYTQQATNVLMHIDLHETTDTDNSEFTPAKAARDGADLPEWDPIPDGFYSIGHTLRPEVEWHKAMIAAVKEVTHIAQPLDSEKPLIIGEPVVAEGIVLIACDGVCGIHTAAQFTATSEVYPDSPKTTDAICNKAQCACVTSGLTYALANAK